MLSNHDIKKMAIDLGAEKCGIAACDRFSGAPEGYRPTDIWDRCQSVIVFLKSMPPETIMADNPVPYTHAAGLLYGEIDRLGLALCRLVESHGIHAIPIPCDNPYLFWDAERSRGQAILSMRHAGHLAGLGILGKNTLLMNRDLGNMVTIGAVLCEVFMESDPMADDFSCPLNCTICLDACPQKALDGTTVDQALCRKQSFMKTGRGFEIYRCNQCRRSCPGRLGYTGGLGRA